MTRKSVNLFLSICIVGAAVGGAQMTTARADAATVDDILPTCESEDAAVRRDCIEHIVQVGDPQGHAKERLRDMSFNDPALKDAAAAAYRELYHQEPSTQPIAPPPAASSPAASPPPPPLSPREVDLPEYEGTFPPIQLPPPIFSRWAETVKLEEHGHTKELLGVAGITLGSAALVGGFVYALGSGFDDDPAYRSNSNDNFGGYLVYLGLATAVVGIVCTVSGSHDVTRARRERAALLALPTIDGNGRAGGVVQLALTF